MKRQDFLDLLCRSPVVASVKDGTGLERALESTCEAVFLLYGDVLTAAGLAERVKAAGKACFVHLDLVEGLSPREVAVDFLRRNTPADGILTTRPQLVHRAHELGLLTVQRFFLLDSMALANMHRQLEQSACDLVEVLPGVIPKVIGRVAAEQGKPVIAGGLIQDKEDVTAALSAGAAAVSSTEEKVWFL